jgi:hypothetical protein
MPDLRQGPVRTWGDSPMSGAYSPAPPVVRVTAGDGTRAVINLNHLVSVEDFASDPDHSIVRLSTGATITIAMTVDDFWDML